MNRTIASIATVAVVAGGFLVSVSFALAYEITASAGSGGTINPTGLVTGTDGTNKPFLIVPNANNHIVDVLVDGGSAGQVGMYLFSAVAGVHTIDATFAPDTYTITATAGANGSIGPNGAVTVNGGSDQAFAITPNPGFQITDVFVDGVSVGAVSNHTITNISANHTVDATFAANTYTITATAGTNGSISPNGTVSVNGGANQAFAITPNSGFTVADVLVDGVSFGLITNHTFTAIAGNRTISATFAATPVVPVITINTLSPLPEATVGSAYAQIIAATSSDPGDMLVWSVSAGALPSGLSLNALGVITGTPNVAIGTSFSIQTSGANASSTPAVQAYTLTVIAAPSGGGGGGGSGDRMVIPPVTATSITGATTDGLVLGATVTNSSAIRQLIDAVKAKLIGLQQQLISLKLAEAKCDFFLSRNLSQGARGADVKNLQRALNTAGITVATTGAGSAGNETAYFGPATKTAVAAFQNMFAADILAPEKLAAGNGIVGSATRAVLNKLCAQEQE